MKQRKSGKQKENKENWKKILNAKEEVLKQEVKLLNWPIQKPIKIYGGKQGPFFRPEEKETKVECMKYELVNTPEKRT